MPNAEELLRSLQFTASRYLFVSITWHVLIYALIVFLVISKRKISTRAIASLLTMSLFSVAALSADAGNPFNAIVFSLIGLLMIISIFKMNKSAFVFSKSLLMKSVGFFLMLAGLLYPHFSTSNPELLFLTAPTGIIPCPTLLLICGVTLLLESFSRRWMTILIIVSLFYGLFGIFRLHVYIDVLLLFAGVALVLKYFSAGIRTPKVNIPPTFSMMN